MALRAQYTLADGSTAFPVIVADGSYPAAVGSNQGVQWRGGNGALEVVGTVGGGTYTLQIQAPDGTWLTIGTAVTLTAQGLGGFSAPAGNLRLLVAGSTTPSIKAWVIGIPSNNQGN